MTGWRAVLAGLAVWLALEAAAVVVVFALVEGAAVRGCGAPIARGGE